MRKGLLTWLVLVLIAAGTWTVRGQEAVGTADNFSGSDPLTGLGWMVGTWRSKIHEVEQEEFWTEPKGRIMLGLHRDTPRDGKAFFEYLRIEYERDGIFYVASPRGKGSTRFKLIEETENKAVFFNAENEFPNTITYWLDDEKMLCARIEGSGDARSGSQRWCWKKLGGL